MEITDVEYRRAKIVIEEIERRYGKLIEEVIRDLEGKPLDLQEVDDLVEGDAAQLIVKLYGQQRTSKRRGRALEFHKKERG